MFLLSVSTFTKEIWYVASSDSNFFEAETLVILHHLYLTWRGLVFQRTFPA